MGTRADFYLGRGVEAKWLGSIGWDGYPDGMPKALLEAPSETKFLAAVKWLSKREDWTAPKMGWPWPWDTSHTTDYAYAYEKGIVYASSYGGPWFEAAKPEPENNPGERAEFPDMSSVKNVDLGKRSGLIMIGGKK